MYYIYSINVTGYNTIERSQVHNIVNTFPIISLNIKHKYIYNIICDQKQSNFINKIFDDVSHKSILNTYFDTYNELTLNI